MGLLLAGYSVGLACGAWASQDGPAPTLIYFVCAFGVLVVTIGEALT